MREFLGNAEALNYELKVVNMPNKFKTLDCLLSLKVLFLHNPLNIFPETFDDGNKEQVERFHQDIKEMDNDTRDDGIST